MAKSNKFPVITPDDLGSSFEKDVKDPKKIDVKLNKEQMELSQAGIGLSKKYEQTLKGTPSNNPIKLELSKSGVLTVVLKDKSRLDVDLTPLLDLKNK